MKFIFSIFMAILLFVACKSEKTANRDNSTVDSEPLPSVNAGPVLSSITAGKMDTMLNMVDYIDYLWPSLPISTSLETRDDIKLNIGLISPAPLNKIPNNCKPLGRKFFNIKGNTFAVADIYFSESCKFYVFLDGEKPINANFMTPDAVSFYNGILQAAKQPTIK